MLEDLADLTQVNFAAQEQKSAFSNAAKLAQKPMINPVLLGIVASPEIDSFRLLSPWDFPGNSTGVDCHFLLQWIFPTQGSNPGLPHCRQMLYRLSHQGSPILNLPLFKLLLVRILTY